MLKKWDVTIPALTGDVPRKAYIYLPEYYDDDPNRRFPVMYMFDGQNIFLDEDASYGKSWGMYNFMQWTRKPLIIVAVECNRFGERFNEYAPVTYENREHGFIKSKGRLYMNWLINELKPYIDENYRTLPDRKNTIIAGSSMGGLMALYGVTCYNKIFQRAAVLSPSLWVAPSKLYNLVARANMRFDTTIYMERAFAAFLPGSRRAPEATDDTFYRNRGSPWGSRNRDSDRQAPGGSAPRRKLPPAPRPSSARAWRH